MVVGCGATALADCLDLGIRGDLLADRDGELCSRESGSSLSNSICGRFGAARKKSAISGKRKGSKYEDREHHRECGGGGRRVRMRGCGESDFEICDATCL